MPSEGDRDAHARVVDVGVSAGRFRLAVDVVDEPVQVGIFEPSPPQVLHVRHRVAVADVRQVAGDDVGHGAGVEQSSPELVRVEAAGQSARGVLGTLEWPRNASERLGGGGVGADEAGGCGHEPAGDDEVVQGNVMTAESPCPDAITGPAEDPEPVEAGVPTTLPAPVNGPAFQLVSTFSGPSRC
ncbi:hypothetical protein OG866_43630 [Streptomyces sp. NBC_00663]|nr:hypothetical protein [Streptomyces sp. NBC_00663]